MPDPYSRLSLATMGESQAVGVGTAGFGGVAAGLAAAGVAGAAGLAGAGFVSDETETDSGKPPSGEPEGVAFTPPAPAGCSAVGFGSPSGGGEEGDLISSGIFAQAQTYGSVCIEKSDNFYQLEGAKSTRASAAKLLSCALVP